MSMEVVAKDWSFSAPASLFAVPNLSAHAKLVYLVIASYANAWERTAFPSIQTIVERSSLSKSTVLRALKELENHELVQKEMRKNDKQEHMSNLYTVKAPKGSVSETLPPSVSETLPSVSETPPVVSEGHPNITIFNTTKEQKNIKIEYAELVTMTEHQYNLLVSKHGLEKTKGLIEMLSDGKNAKGYTYKSDYHAINMWVVKEWEKRESERAKGNRSYQPRSPQGPQREKPAGITPTPASASSSLTPEQWEEARKVAQKLDERLNKGVSE